MLVLELNIAQTVGAAAVCLAVGEFVKNRVDVLSRYFIPAPVIGGLIVSLLLLGGYLTDTFDLAISDSIKDFLLVVFFTTIGFSASFELLKKGGVAVALFLAVAVVLVILQNVVGVGIASIMGANPLLGLAAGSISMTGGHGTSGAFAPLLAEKGLNGALPAAIAASTWGLVVGCMIGGPVGRYLMQRRNLQGPAPTAAKTRGRRARKEAVDEAVSASATTAATHEEEKSVSMAMYGVMLLAVAVGVGSYVTDVFGLLGISVPAYIGAMLVAAILRNIIDIGGFRLPEKEFSVMGNISLAFFLSMALMSMKLWELADVFGPLVVILLAQTVLMAAYAMFITFNVMGRDYDAAVMANGHCGFGMGATPNAMANMHAFTLTNGVSKKAFFVIPLVGSLFIDFFNVSVITFSLHIVDKFF